MGRASLANEPVPVFSNSCGALRWATAVHRRGSDRIYAIWFGEYRSATDAPITGIISDSRQRRVRSVPAKLERAWGGPFRGDTGTGDPLPRADSRCGVLYWISVGA